MNANRITTLLTLATLLASPLWAGDYSKKASKDIVDTAIAAGSFETLVTAVKAAGLVGTLKGEGPFTVFAPTDEAFAKLPEGTLQGLLADKDMLTAVLTYHVVPGKVMSDEVIQSKEAKTVQGDFLSIDSSYGVRIDNAKVIQADIETSNGVIHVIDSVLLPGHDHAHSAPSAR